MAADEPVLTQDAVYFTDPERSSTSAARNGAVAAHGLQLPAASRARSRAS